jgi:hypothetical protein
VDDVVENVDTVINAVADDVDNADVKNPRSFNFNAKEVINVGFSRMARNRMSLSRLIFIRMPLNRLTLSRMAFSRMAFSRMAFSKKHSVQ